MNDLSVFQVARALGFTHTLISVIQVSPFWTVAAINRYVDGVTFNISVGEGQACLVTGLSVVTECLVSSTWNS